MARRPTTTVLFFGLAGCACLVAAAISFTALATQFDNNIYDFLFRIAPPPRVSAPVTLLVFDENTFKGHGGVRNLRTALAGVLERIAAAHPAAVAVDITLTDPGEAEEDARLAAAFAHTPNLALACEMTADGSAWQDPAPAFLQHAAALGHVSTLPGPYDNVNRRITLERVSNRTRRWALSLEGLRLFHKERDILSSPDDVSIGGLVINSRWDEGRPLRVRFAEGSIPSISAADILAGKDPAALAGRVVFIGITATSAVPDRLFTPVSRFVPTPGVEIHAQAFQTMQAGLFLDDVPLSVSLLIALCAALLAAAALAFLRGWKAWAAVVGLLAVIHILPYVFLTRGLVLAPFASVTGAWFAVLACASYRYFFVRRSLDVSEATTARYQEAFHFVAHEMRTPLTAIQGSSELMTRYNLPDPKRRELGLMINSESKRLARMITTFLDVEKLSAGQMELRLTSFPLQELVDTCYQRSLPLAERKQIRVTSEVPDDLVLNADRELMEYALYNVMTNAIKYSAPETDVIVGARRTDGGVFISVRDHGMGMDAAEVKNLFRKFYRTRRAEQSGETGTGIGLSIVHQIVDHHGGRIDVESEPGQGSTFTLVLPATIH